MSEKCQQRTRKAVRGEEISEPSKRGWLWRHLSGRVPQPQRSFQEREISVAAITFLRMTLGISHAVIWVQRPL
jgi:hypothetical protein